MIRSSRRTSVGILAALAGLTLASTTSAATPGFYVQGRHLYDRCGEQVVLRGVNEMVVWSANQDGTPFFSEIARTGANVVRIAWTTDGSVSNLERAITNALGVDLIPMPELHDATGELSGVSACVDWWVRNDVVQMIQRYEERMVLNIANEAGDDAVTEQQFVSTYSSAITRMRNAGINVPLIIDASSWGQDIDMLQAAGPALVDADPDGNVMFSVHMWWGDPAGDRVRTELQQSADEGLPLIVGEFALSAFSGCGDNPFAYRVLLSEAERLQIGWLAWSWGGVDNADCAPTFDMTTNGTFGSWENAWGEEVAVTDANSIQNTSVRPYSATHDGACDPNGTGGSGTGGSGAGGSGTGGDGTGGDGTGGDGTGGDGTGGTTTGVGGWTFGVGGATGATGGSDASGGSDPGSGGSGIGGTDLGSGGSGTGGSDPGSGGSGIGGTDLGSGGSGVGGAALGSGGAGVGGAVLGSGGAGTGGAPATGGAVGLGGSASPWSGAAGQAGSIGTFDASTDEGGCGCSVPGSGRRMEWLAALLTLGLLRRRRRSR